MTTSNGPSKTDTLPDGKRDISPERRPGGVLLTVTQEEIEALFRLAEAFPWSMEEEEEHAARKTWWERVKSWLRWRPAGSRPRVAPQGGDEPGAAAESVGRPGAERGGGKAHDDAAAAARAAVEQAAHRFVAGLPGSYPRGDR